MTEKEKAKPGLLYIRENSEISEPLFFLKLCIIYNLNY